MLRFGHASLAFLCACTYTWPIGSSPTDAGHDATLDAPPGDASGDSGPDPDANDADVGPDGSDNCAPILAKLKSTRAAAIRCVAPGNPAQCYPPNAVFDECGCNVWVGDKSKPESQMFADAVDAAVSAGCKGNCGMRCVDAGSFHGNCLFDGEGGLACAPGP